MDYWKYSGMCFLWTSTSSTSLKTGLNPFNRQFSLFFLTNILQILVDLCLVSFIGSKSLWNFWIIARGFWINSSQWGESDSDQSHSRCRNEVSSDSRVNFKTSKYSALKTVGPAIEQWLSPNTFGPYVWIYCAGQNSLNLNKFLWKPANLELTF